MPRAKTASRKSKSKPRTPRKRSRRTKPELKHVPWSSVELEQLNPLLQRQLMVGDKLMLARVLLKKGCLVPRHSHFHEQVSYVLEGSLRFFMDDGKILVKAGEVLAIPPHMPHKVEAMTDSVSLDIFYPPRQDWLDGTDQYLRG